MKIEFWDLMARIFQKKCEGICHCDLLRLKEGAFSIQPDTNPKCIFCIAKTPEGRSHDADFANDRIKDYARETRTL